MTPKFIYLTWASPLNSKLYIHCLLYGLLEYLIGISISMPHPLPNLDSPSFLSICVDSNSTKLLTAPYSDTYFSCISSLNSNLPVTQPKNFDAILTRSCIFKIYTHFNSFLIIFTTVILVQVTIISHLDYYQLTASTLAF